MLVVVVFRRVVDGVSKAQEEIWVWEEEESAEQQKSGFGVTIEAVKELKDVIPG